MIRINLLTEAKAAAARKKTSVIPTGAKLNNLVFAAGVGFGVLYLAIMGFLLVGKRRDLDSEIGKARIEADRLKSIIEEVKGYEDKKKSLEEKIELINNLKTNQKGPVRLMDEVSKALPDLVWLTDMSISGDQLSLKGRTLSPNAVATYLENLKKSPYFAEPVFKNLGRENGPQGIYQWEMAVTFTNGKPAPAPGAPATPGKPGPHPTGAAGARTGA